MTAKPRRKPFVIGDLEVAGGRAGSGELPVARLVTGSRISIPIRVLHGRRPGPTVWLSGAVHGDEVAGVEIIRRTLAAIDSRALTGTVIAVPIVNVHGFLNGDRYLPDRRDLNRSFPGSANGSLAGRIANLFMTKIVERCEVGIDLHTGSDHRTNLPQIRADLDDETTRELAVAFGAPVMLHAKLRDGSMRAAATAAGATMLLYEGGEAWRFDEDALATGTRGIGRVLQRMGMIEGGGDGDEDGDGEPPVESRSSSWVRARRSGIASLDIALGDRVDKGRSVATIRDSVGSRLSVARAHRAGVVIGHTQHPLVNQGDAIVHIAEINQSATADARASGDATDSKDTR